MTGGGPAGDAPGDDAAPNDIEAGNGADAGDELEITGRITTASNATFLAQLGETTLVYKPIAGEKPLWDFPDGNLAHREVAAYLVSESVGWNVVPRTWLHEGPFGLGMVPLWQELDEEQDPVDLVAADSVPDTGWCTVFDGRDEDNRSVVLIHEDTMALRRMAVFDVVTNNADRKGNHILPMPGGHRHGVDHGLTFHEEHKLRTVLWGWRGSELTPDERGGVERVLADLSAGLGDSLAELVTRAEITAFARRCDRLLQRGRFPAPRGQMPAMPWPLF